MSLQYPETYKKQSLSLLDKDFLATLSEQREHEIFAKVIALDINENPVDQIEGRVTSGSINIDGSSSMRRTCNLSLISQDINVNDFYWGVKTKITLEIGLRNQLKGQYAPGENSNYPEIVWFPQGYYIITSFSMSIGLNSNTISISGKDKMCLLDGSIGGQLYGSVDFGKEEEEVLSMEKITDTNFTSSVDILQNSYYLKSGEEETQYQPDEDDEKVIPDVPSSQDLPYPTHLFILDKKRKGNYYKKNNAFYLITSKNPAPSNCKVYNMYKKIQKHGELFYAKKSSTSYKQNTFYYKKDHEFLLDTSSKSIENRTYYKLKPLYKRLLSSSFKQIPLEKIIREAVHAYAKEPYHNIIINDLDNYGLEQLTYKGDTPLYALYNTGTEEFENLILGNSNKSLAKIVKKEGFNFYSLNSSFFDVGTPIKITSKNVYTDSLEPGDEIGQPNIYTVAKFTYGMDLGYRLTDLTYTGDLISSIGDSLVTILDKIKTMLSDFEYFYDINGRFIFQKKKTYVNTSWNQLTDDGSDTFVDYTDNKQKFSFNFEGNRLITALSNNPDLANLKNDFVVWGKRESVASGEGIAIHARYAIDQKPVHYKALDGKIYVSDIEYAFEQKDILKEGYQIDTTLSNELKSFQLDDSLYPYMGLSKPVKNINGTFSPGWWHILDWSQYYYLLTGKRPEEKMKDYFSLTAQDVPLNTISSLPMLSEEERIAYTQSSQRIWFIQINKSTQEVKVNFQLPSDPKELLYTSYINNLDTYDFYFYNLTPNGKTVEEYIQEQIPANKAQYLQDHHIYIVDWREIIYQMASDFFAGQGCSNSNPLYISEDGEHFETMTDPDHFLYQVGSRNPYYYPTGYTGYEQYYTDMEGFWRQLYNPFYVPQPEYVDGHYTNRKLNNGTKVKLWVDPYIKDYTIGYYVNKDREDISKQIKDLNKMLNNAQDGNNKAKDTNQKKTLEAVIKKYNKYALSEKEILKENNKEDNLKFLYWNIAIFEDPETLNFWFDFLDSDLELAQFSVKQIGDRIKVVNEEQVTSIIYKEIPNFILYETTKTKTVTLNNGTTTTVEVCDTDKLRDDIKEKSGYTFICLQKGLSQYFTISYRGTSAKDKLDSMLYDYGYCNESISITAIPIYYLEPNTRIFVQDKKTGINGEYIVDKISLPLAYNGTMSITAVKAPERLY